MKFVLPDLPYAYDALAPFTSAETLEYHHDKHHKTYVTKANALIKGTGLEDKSLEEVVKESFKSNKELFDNAAQHYNHLHFWQMMKKGGGGKKLPKKLGDAMDKQLGGFENFRKNFLEAGAKQFGAGWAWLCIKNDKLEILKTPNGENPLVHGAEPILGVDVWEHSYYLDYRNERPKYLEVFFDNLINWEYAEHLYNSATA